MSAVPNFRRAMPADSYQIVDLYRRIYQGTYSDPMMADAIQLAEVLTRDEYHWIVGESNGEIVGSVVYRYDRANALAKVYGAVVEPRFRGHNLTENMMKYGYESLRQMKPPVEVVYATTRPFQPRLRNSPPISGTRNSESSRTSTRPRVMKPIV